jgi:hypothetical protein
VTIFEKDFIRSKLTLKVILLLHQKVNEQFKHEGEGLSDRFLAICEVYRSRIGNTSFDSLLTMEEDQL